MTPTQFTVLTRASSSLARRSPSAWMITSGTSASVVDLWKFVTLSHTPDSAHLSLSVCQDRFGLRGHDTDQAERQRAQDQQLGRPPALPVEVVVRVVPIPLLKEWEVDE